MASPFSKSEDLIDFLVTKGNGVKGLSQMGLEVVPREFIQPSEEGLESLVVSNDSVPIIDVSNWSDPKVSDSICKAATKWGFFQIINHGIPFEILENVKEAAHRFFELPVEERTKYLKEKSPSHTVQLKTSFNPQVEKVLEWKDYLFHIYNPDDAQFWPHVSKDQVLEYMEYAKHVIRKLLDILLKGLNVKGIDEAQESVLMGTLIVSLIHYPICPNPEITAGAGRHSDISTITVLLQDEVGGLYVRGTGGDNWIHVNPIKGALVVNIGDILQIMSNDRYKSIEHRVFVSANKNRVSVPIFVNPASDAVIGPLSEVLDKREKLLYKQIVYSDYFNYFFSKGHDGKQTLECAKI